jgi:hypothetical protein
LAALAPDVVLTHGAAAVVALAGDPDLFWAVGDPVG